MRLLFHLVLGVMALGLSSIHSIAKNAERPNIVLILADDLGWADLGCYGNKFNETPNIDRLASQGVRFTDFYAAGAVCSPTRASIMSGQYQARFGLTAHIIGHWRPFEKLVEPPNALQLPLEINTIAEQLQKAGYATGYFGKWHLGGKAFGPEKQGFETVREVQGHDIGRSRDQAPGTPNRRSCDFLAELTEQFIEQRRDQPFFVQVNPSAVHIPLVTTPELQKKYEAKPKVDGYSCHPLYAGLLEELDTLVGRVMKALERAGVAENTIVIFTSDNGGLEREMGGWPGTLNRPLRNEKGSLYEGGIRTPMITRWPKQIKAGSTTSTPAISVDFYPTLLQAANLKTGDTLLDGASLLPVMKDSSAKLKRETLYWHYPHYHHSRPSGAVRHGDWKLIEFFDTRTTELYNLREDISEAHDVASKYPEKTAQLHAMLKSWRKEVCAQMPQNNPAYNPERANEWWNRAKLEPAAAPGTYRR